MTKSTKQTLNITLQQLPKSTSKPTPNYSSAENVDRYLQTLELTQSREPLRQLSPEEQLFTEEELARLVNPDKLKALMNNGDDFLGYLTGEIDKFQN
ncbi:hypothetical protein [Psychrobacter sp.]|uniref:hypothetical protein n=1 Tax=Psychrobacter sp. TaxID=56811 RepID=UPI0025DFA832|nr:hypothetical protein [Psychrobacter sp.]